MSSSTSNGSSLSGVESKDNRHGHKFLTLIDETTVEIHTKVQEYQEILNTDQISISSSSDEQDGEADLAKEEIKGKLRAAIGKAHLLVDKKFKQFKELCQKNLSEQDDAPFRTLNEDLAGFWDLVSIQVSDVRDTFTEIDQMKNNNWKLDAQEHIPQIVKSSKKVTESQINESSNQTTKGMNNCTKAKDDEERRKRLQEAKKRAAQIKAAASENGNGTTDEPVTIFVSKTSIANSS